MILMRSLHFFISLTGFILLCAISAFSQSDKSVFLIQTFDDDSALVQQGTGFFLKDVGFLSHAHHFTKARSANIRLSDGTVGQISRIVDVDPASGVVRFELEKSEQLELPGLDRSMVMSQEGDFIDIISADPNLSSKSSPISIKKKMNFVGYGESVLLGDKLKKDLLGSPALNSIGDVEGVVIAMDQGKSELFLSNMSFLDKFEPISKTMSEFDLDFTNDWYLLQGIKSYLAQDFAAAIIAFEKSMEESSYKLTAHYYTAMVYYNRGQFNAARSEFKMAIAINPAIEMAYFNVGRIDYYSKDYQSARKYFDQAEAHSYSDLQLFELRGNLNIISRIMVVQHWIL